MCICMSEREKKNMITSKYNISFEIIIIIECSIVLLQCTNNNILIQSDSDANKSFCESDANLKKLNSDCE